MSQSPSSRDLGSLASSASSIYTLSTSERRRGLDPSGILASESRQTAAALAETSILVSDAGSSVTFDQIYDNSATNEQDPHDDVFVNTPAAASSSPATTTTISPGEAQERQRSDRGGPLGRSLRSLMHRSSQDYALLRALATNDNTNYNKNENRIEIQQSPRETQAVLAPDGSGSEGTLQTRAIIREPQEPFNPLTTSRPQVVEVDAAKKAPPPPLELNVNANQAQVLHKESYGNNQKQQQKTPPSRREIKKETIKPAPQQSLRPRELSTVPQEESGPPQQQQQKSTPPPNPIVFPANATASGKALEFTQKFIQRHQNWTESTQGRCMSTLVTLCSADDLAFFAEQMLLHREQLQQTQQPGPVSTVKTTVDMAYAFAPAAAHQQPHQHEEGRLRAASLYTTSSREAVFGQGIYTSKSVYAGQRHQWKSMPRIFLVARFLGNAVHVGTSSVSNNILRGGTNVDSVVGMLATEEVAVLRRSSQCLPLLKIEPDFLLVSHAQGNIVLSHYQNKLSEALDALFNGGQEAAAKPIVSNETTPSPPQLSVAAAPPPQQPTPATPAPPASAAAVPTPAPVPALAEPTPEVAVKEFPRMLSILLYTAPTSQRQRQASDLPAPLVIDANVNLKTMKPLHPRHGPPAARSARCGVPLSSVVKIIPSKPPEPGSNEIPPFSMAYSCGSTFNVGIDASLREFATWPSLLDDYDLLQRIQSRVVEHSRRCKTGCHRHRDTQCEFTTPVGTMPSGSMRIDELPDLTCPGFNDETNDSGGRSGSFLITYRIRGGMQCDYHPNPGQAFPPVYREAFLPANWEGRALLKRLQYAFVRGLTFRVGQSVTTGVPGVITWASIPHKTTLFHHLYGYPDPDFFVNANKELDSLGVPVASDL